jgi:hypothetical protein
MKKVEQKFSSSYLYKSYFTVYINKILSGECETQQVVL